MLTWYFFVKLHYGILNSIWIHRCWVTFNPDAWWRSFPIYLVTHNACFRTCPKEWVSRKGILWWGTQGCIHCYLRLDDKSPQHNSAPTSHGTGSNDSVNCILESCMATPTQALEAEQRRSMDDMREIITASSQQTTRVHEVCPVRATTQTSALPSGARIMSESAMHARAALQSNVFGGNN